MDTTAHPHPTDLFFQALLAWREENVRRKTRALETEKAEHSILLADILLAQQDAIGDWMSTHAVQFDRRTCWQDDWVALLVVHAPTFVGVEVNHNLIIESALHAALDELGGCPGIRNYAW